jgi:hypothetical protein
VTLDSVTLYAGYGLAVGLIMYFWTDFRLKRQQRKVEAARLARARATAYEAEDSGDDGSGEQRKD